MKITAVLKGDKTIAPLHLKQEHNSFWSTFEAPENGVVLVLNDPTEQLAGGVFIEENRLLELTMILDVMKEKRRQAKGAITKEELVDREKAYEDSLKTKGSENGCKNQQR